MRHIRDVLAGGCHRLIKRRPPPAEALLIRLHYLFPPPAPPAPAPGTEQMRRQAAIVRRILAGLKHGAKVDLSMDDVRECLMAIVAATSPAEESDAKKV